MKQEAISHQFVYALSVVPLKVKPPQRVTLSLEKQEIKDRVLKRISDEGFDPQVVDKIIMCESGYNPQAKHLNANGTWDIGLFQINDIHGLSVEDRMDEDKSTEFALILMKSKRGLKHWACYSK